MTRQEANFAIIHNLYRVVIDNPDWRFSQLLVNMKVVKPVPNKDYWLDEYNMESEKLLERIKK